MNEIGFSQTVTNGLSPLDNNIINQDSLNIEDIHKKLPVFEDGEEVPIGISNNIGSYSNNNDINPLRNFAEESNENRTSVTSLLSSSTFKDNTNYSKISYPENLDYSDTINNLSIDGHSNGNHINASERNSSDCINLVDQISQSSISDESITDFSSESISSESKDIEKDVSKESPLVLQPEKYKQEISELVTVIERLKNERDNLAVEASHAACHGQLEQLQREIELFKQEHELDSRTQATMKLEIDALQKQYEIANKEREASVMRYATSEMEVINQRKERENLEKKCKELMKDKDGLSSKLKTVMIEKARIGQLLDNKCSEVANAQRDVEKLKEELNSRDIKIKWTQNKLKCEIESHKESEAQVEKLTLKILEAKEEVEKAKKDAEMTIKQFQCSQENKAYILEQQMTEQQAQLILERHNLEDKENSNKQLQHEIETLRNKQLLLIDENNALKLKVCSLEKERQDHEQAITRLRESFQKSSSEVDELHEKTSTMDNLKLQLQQEREKVINLQTEVSQLKASNDELLHDMASCREREADMLEFTQKVTSKNVRLQSEFSCIEAKARQLESEEEPLQRKVNELTKKIEALQKELNKERSDRGEEKKLVARHLAEKTAKIEALMKEIDDLRGENQVMKHKQAAKLRELNREVAQYRRRLDQFEASSGSDSLCQGSRASSCNSLNDTSSTITSISVNGNTMGEPDKQTMIDRILRLQKENVRLREKIDFLEEHSKQLVAELQKKTRVLQSYILREEAGTLTSGSMDLHKAEVAKHGGIMASMYGSKTVDDTMTLELSLEINRKLQAVLEDTLLKNITLKENIDTLGDEIRRLSKKS